MTIQHLLCVSALTLTLCGPAFAQEARGPYVRLAELEIDPVQLENFKVAVKEGIETAVRVEPGVLVLYAVSEKDHPTRIKVFEMYADEERTGRTLKRRISGSSETTNAMVKSRRLIDADPIMLGAK